ncbi:unnamed protein product [Danaus chrysippus]|uniref:(African queen) hypothetical protein n=1 Tax=Danaus chrysippus TaxID=151541 RepID=A0A8J2R159_9NEOP|nr:unnamed protein product [Danaus chrysippus]
MVTKYSSVLSLAILCVFMPLYEAANETDNVFIDSNNDTHSERTGRNLHKECNGNISVKCLKMHAISFIEDINSYSELRLFPGLSIVRDNQTNNTSPEEMAAELARQYPGKPDEKLNRYLLYSLQNYLDGHSLRYRLLDPETSKDALNMAKGDKAFVGRGKGGGLGGGKGGGNGALIAALLMMKGTLAAAALGALALLAGKAMMTALMSLLLSALVGLKGGGGHKSTTYEIITKPEISHHHSNSHEEHHEHDHGHHGGYRRAYDTDFNHYNSYMPYDATR